MAKLKDNIKRLKAMPVSIGNISNEKLNRILLIREKYIEHANIFVEENFQHCFFAFEDFKNPKKALSKGIEASQKSVPKGVLNKTYLEKARKEVTKVLWNRIVAGKKSFLSVIHNIDKKQEYSKKKLAILESKNETPQKYKYFSVDIQDSISESDLDFIKKEYKSMNSKERIQNTREIIQGRNLQFSDKQIEIIQYLYNQTTERFEKPRFGYNHDFSSTIDLDYRVIANYKEKIEKLDNDLNLFIDKDNQLYHFFLELSDPTIHGKKIKIPLAINFKEWRRTYSKKESASKSFSLVINKNNIEVKHVIEKEDLDTSLQACFNELQYADYLVARDFGYKETISLSVIKNEFNLSIEDFEARLKLNKKATKELYETHFHIPEVLENLQFSGKKFLNKIYIISSNIDDISSVISKKYNEIEELLTDIRQQLDIDETVCISNKLKTNKPTINAKIDLFFKLLSKVKKSKQKRRDMYKKIKGIKRSWFGYLSSQELKLIKKYKAAFVCEDLTVMAAEKDKPDYKGRRFNKMINNGSKGQYMRIAQEKLFWNGILEHRIPSFYSSTTCTKHSIIDKNMRKGAIFKCKECDKKENADIHASSTISSFLLLKPRL